jgi:hypothetical protein
LLVWAIFLYYAYVIVSAAVSYHRGYFEMSHGVQIPVPKSASEKAIRGGVLVLGLAAAIELFRMRRAAVPIYTAAWIARAMMTTYDIASAVTRPRFNLVLMVALVAFGAFTAIAGYAVSLQRKGRLRAGV